MNGDAGELPVWAAGGSRPAAGDGSAGVGTDAATGPARPAGLRRRRRERTTAALVLLAVVSGLVVFVTVVPTLVAAAPPVQSVPVPATLTAECAVGTYSVFERSRPGGGSGVPADGVSVLGPDGVPVQVRMPARAAVLERSDARWVAVAEFPAVRAGAYDVKVEGEATVVTVERADPDTAAVPWPVVVPAALVLVASVVAIVVLTVRGRRSSAPSA